MCRMGRKLMRLQPINRRLSNALIGIKQKIKEAREELYNMQ